MYITQLNADTARDDSRVVQRKLEAAKGSIRALERYLDVYQFPNGKIIFAMDINSKGYSDRDETPATPFHLHFENLKAQSDPLRLEYALVKWLIHNRTWVHDEFEDGRKFVAFYMIKTELNGVSFAIPRIEVDLISRDRAHGLSKKVKLEIMRMIDWLCTEMKFCSIEDFYPEEHRQLDQETLCLLENMKKSAHYS